MIHARATRSIMTNWLPIRLETFATLSAQYTTARFKVTLPSYPCSGYDALHTVASMKLSHAISVLDQHTLPQDGSPGQCNEIHRMIRKSQCLVYLRKEVEGVWEVHVLTRLSKCIQCTIMQRHPWWPENYEGYRFTGVHWRAIGSVWPANLFLKPYK